MPFRSEAAVSVHFAEGWAIDSHNADIRALGDSHIVSCLTQANCQLSAILSVSNTRQLSTYSTFVSV
jgi:hypothetical protein